jgi:hypothetical protein
VNWKASGESDPVVLETVETGQETRTVPSEAQAEGDWLCAWCYHRVANESDRFTFQGNDEFLFSNPAGLRFHILLFSQASGCAESGIPTLEHTWFSGHSWSFAQCAACGQHLGWFYTGPQEFVGLIKDRIVRGLCVRN